MIALQEICRKPTHPPKRLYMLLHPPSAHTLRASILAVYCVVAAGAAFSEPLKVYINSSQEPKSWSDKDGKIKGYAADMTLAVFKDAGVDFIFQGRPFPRALEETRNCEGVMVGVYKNEDRAKFLNFSDEMDVDTSVVVTRKDSPLRYTKPADLEGKTVTYLRGGFFIPILSPVKNIQLDDQTSQEIMMKKLAAGRTDVVVINPKESVAAAASAAGVANTDLRISAIPLATASNHIVACKTKPEHAELLRKLNTSIARLKKDGTFQAIMKNY